MRVGFIVYALNRPLTGIGRYNVGLIRGMAGLPDAPEIVLMLAGGIGSLQDLGLQSETLDYCERLPMLISLGNLHVTRLCRKYKFDVVHDLSGVTPFVLGTSRARKVVTLHDVVPWSFPGVSSRWDTLVYRHWLPRTVPTLDGVLTVSKYSRQDISRYLKTPLSNVFAVRHGGVSSIYRPASAEMVQQVRDRYRLPERYLLYVGSVEERKNIRRVLQAFECLRKAGDFTHRLVIVGPKQWKYDEIMDSLRKSQLQDEIILTGFVADADLPAIYTGADVFLFPSLYEGLGLPVLEAMACGVPVITSNVSSLPEVSGDAGINIDPYDVDALVNATRQVLANPQLQQELRQKGLQHAAGYNWIHTAKETVRVYEHLLEKSGSRSI